MPFFHNYTVIIVTQTCNFINNTAPLGKGGALQGNATELKGKHLTFAGNSAYSGGAIDTLVKLIHLYYSNFTKNIADSFGGAIRAENCFNFTVSHNIFYADEADTGAGLELTRVEIAVPYSSEFMNNIAVSYKKSKVGGGAIRMILTKVPLLDSHFVTKL